ncbi:MAG: hypothetical protein ACJ763_12225, partial [Bdellovibrionia bacterium]
MGTPLRGFAQFAVLLALLLPPIAGLPQWAVAADHVTATVTTPSIHELEHGIADRLKRVEEFRFIQQEAERLGVRAWLFGGTAAGYAHYVKWDLQREKGDSRFQSDRFDYDYTNIYRSTQDLDIVIDGNAEQAEKLQNALQEKYPHLQGSKTAWEVRLLTQDMGDKQAILNNPDFLNQHTDSNSTGLIEITKPAHEDLVVRDARDWKSKEPYFLKDIHDGTLHYYFSPSHEATKFAKEGRNPPILSAIRFLTKAFQYELKIKPEDLARIRKIIHDFDPKRDTKNDYVANWIEKNGKKLFQNAVNIEYAWNTLETLGLRKKLQAIQGNATQLDSLAWWMNKEPLRSQLIGQGTGRTAKDLGLDIVAHETGNFLAYESITRAHTGDPNVLISRNNVEGELAIYGHGFYTKTGKEGARGTGLTIRFRLDPNAREESDFTYVADEGFVIVNNKAAMRVIPESLNIGPVEYFKMLAGKEKGLETSDRGILEKLKRRIQAKAKAMSEKESRQVLEIVKSEIQDSSKLKKSAFLSEWFALPLSSEHPELVEALLDLNKERADDFVIRHVLSQPSWKNYPRLVERFLANETLHPQIAMHVLSQPHWKDHPEWVEKILKKIVEGAQSKGKVVPGVGEMATYVLSQSHWKEHPEFVEQLLSLGIADLSILKNVLSKPHWKDHPEWVERLLKKNDNIIDENIVEHVLSQPHWKDHPEWVQTLIQRGKLDNAIAKHVLSKPHWKDHPEFVSTLIEREHDGKLGLVF